MKRQAMQWVIRSAIVVTTLVTSGAGYPDGPADGPGRPTDVSTTGQSGLYRDSDGSYWCGGECSSGQQCCKWAVA